MANLSRKDCEDHILNEFKKIINIYHDYNPTGTHLLLSYDQNNENEVTYDIRNAYYDRDSIDYVKSINYTKIEG